MPPPHHRALSKTPAAEPWASDLTSPPAQRRKRSLAGPPTGPLPRCRGLRCCDRLLGVIPETNKHTFCGRRREHSGSIKPLQRSSHTVKGTSRSGNLDHQRRAPRLTSGSASPASSSKHGRTCEAITWASRSGARLCSSLAMLKRMLGTRSRAAAIAVGRRSWQATWGPAAETGEGAWEGVVKSRSKRTRRSAETPVCAAMTGGGGEAALQGSSAAQRGGSSLCGSPAGGAGLRTDHRRESLDGAGHRHAVQVVLALDQREHLRDDVLLRPLGAELLGEAAEVVRCRLADRVHLVPEPGQAQLPELVVEELHAQLAREERDVLDDGEADAPVAVLCELDDRREERLRQEVHSDDGVHLVELGDDVQADLRELVLEEEEEEREERLDGGALAENRGDAHDHARESAAHVLAGVARELLRERGEA